MTVEPAGRLRLQMVSGRPSAARVVLCLVGAAGVMTLAFTAVFVIATADEISSPLELLGVIAALLIFWAPISRWTAWYVAVPAVVVVGAATAAVTHRYRRVTTSSRWRRAAQMIAVLVLIVGCWTLLLGIIDLAYNVN